MSKTTADVVIKNGLVIDPIAKTQLVKSIVIDNGKIAEVVDIGQEPSSKEVIDAEGCVVTPGLIDSHCHFFFGGTENGVNPDLTLLPMGITAAVDQGSAGSANFDVFYRDIISRSQMHLFATLNISTQGLPTSRYPENLEPSKVDENRISNLFEKYNTVLKGIKLRISKEIVGALGLQPLEKALEVSEKIGTRIVVHTTNPPVPASELLSYFRKDDIYTHVFAKKGYSVLTEDGTLCKELYQARDRGVILDAADARVHYLFPVIKEALKEGFYPDTLSTDLVQGSCFQPGVFGLPRLMSKYLALGMPLVEIIRCVTYRAAEVMGVEDKIGSFQPGITGDVAIFKLKNVCTEMKDRENNILTIKKLLVPQCTILNGKVVFRQFDF